MSHHQNPTRRSVLAAGASLLAAPAILHAQPRSLKISVYGGFFKKSFDTHIFPAFTQATGIEVESIAQPTGQAWLVQLEQSARANQAPADVSMVGQVPHLTGQATKLWAPLDLARLSHASNLQERFIKRYPDGKVSGIGAVSWYITLVSNTRAYPKAPESWAELWNPANKDKLGLLSLVSNSFLLEVTAKTFFGGTRMLDTEEGQLKAFKKLAELKGNTRLWYRDEAQFEQALKSGEVPMGQYYHDVTTMAAASGQPVRSTFPKEGGILDSGCWAVSRASKKADDAHVFINYMCQPAVQALMSRKVGTSPTVKRSLTDLTDKEFAGVSSEIEPIVPRYDLYQTRSDWLNEKWTQLIAG